ncbi:hypothetical protein FACS1894211_02580 [Clostridia bacterium]|nr:hypothetical protein FACS1894211_02580 [Clostridia bacterium]
MSVVISYHCSKCGDHVELFDRASAKYAVKYLRRVRKWSFGKQVLCGHCNNRDLKK